MQAQERIEGSNDPQIFVRSMAEWIGSGTVAARRWHGKGLALPSRVAPSHDTKKSCLDQFAIVFGKKTSKRENFARLLVCQHKKTTHGMSQLRLDATFGEEKVAHLCVLRVDKDLSSNSSSVLIEPM